MVRNTFLHIPGIGKTTEKRLWTNGIRDWDAIRNLSTSRDFGARIAGLLARYIPESKQALINKDFAFFNRLLKSGEAWRFYPELCNECVFLDIETTGLSPYFDEVTVVGLFDGKDYKVFVKGENLEKFLQELNRFSMVVTFNGSLFDLKFIQNHFPTVKLPPVHVDLRFTTKRLGLSGGLKAVEQTLGLRRPKDVQRLSGYDATILWSRYLRGDKSALELLIKYNMQDVISLKPILEMAYEKLMQRMLLSSLKAPKEIPTSNRNAVHSSPNTWANRFFIRSKSQQTTEIVPELLKRATDNGHPPKIVGIDLTGSSNRASGWALLTGDLIETKLLKTDEEIIAETLAARPNVVSIDSPLSLPVGYPKHTAIYRECERALKRVGISVFWCLLPSMRGLTMRGMLLAKNLRDHGMQVIESYPGAAQDVLLIPRKKASLDELKWGLVRAGFKGNWVDLKISHDELDAITSAFVGLFYLADDYIALGNAQEDYLIIPRTYHFDDENLVTRLGCVAAPNVVSSTKPHSVVQRDGGSFSTSLS
jgi:uncharacterized protein YprB with RNaseH-like and TPR domain/predicted nuclease with RNAse H fold